MADHYDVPKGPRRHRALVTRLAIFAAGSFAFGTLGAQSATSHMGFAGVITIDASGNVTAAATMMVCQPQKLNQLNQSLNIRALHSRCSE